MKWSEEERKGEEKNKIEVRAQGFSGWSKHFTAWNQQPGSHREPHLQLTVWPLGGALLFGRNTRDTERSPSSSRRSISTESDRRFGTETFSGNIPAGVSDVQLCSRSSVLQVATDRRNTEPGFNPDPPASFTE